MEPVFENQGLTSAEPGQESPLGDEYPEGSQALLDSLESAILTAPAPEIDLAKLAAREDGVSPTGWRMRRVCPFCPAAFGSCSHPQAVNPITEASAP